MEICTAIITSMKNIGIDIENNYQEDFDMREFIKDSITFISFIIELENNLNTEIPYEMLSSDKLGSFNGFCNMLKSIISEQ